MEDQVEVLPVKETDIVYQQDRAAIDIQISTAKAYPRSVKRSIEDALTIVTMDTETAATCTYSLPRSGKAITGPSVHLATILAQSWGNMRIEARVTDIGERQITSQAIAFDLEKNIAIKVEVKRNITGKSGRFNDDMITVTGNAANSIALRNAILKVIPRQVIEKVYNAALETITGDISDSTKLIAARNKLLSQIKESYNVTEEEILFAIGKASIDHIDRDNLVTLIGIRQAVKDGDTTVDEAFRSKRKVEPEKVSAEKEKERIRRHIEGAKTEADLAHVVNLVGEYDLVDEFEARQASILKGKNGK